MKSFTICALLAAGVSAVPFVAPRHGAMHHAHHKRDIVWVTETDIDTVVVPVTKTVWVDGNTLSTHEAAYRHRSTRTSQEASTTAAETSAASTVASSSSEYSASAYSAPTSSSSSVYVAPSSSSSVYVAPTTSSTSEYVAPTTTSTSEYVAPTTSSTSAYEETTSAPVYSATSAYVAPSSTTSSAAAVSTSASSGGSTDLGGYSTASGASYTGDYTEYDPSVGLTACGYTKGKGDAIVAMSQVIFDVYTPNGNPNNNPLCGKWITLTNASGNTFQAQVADSCPGCAAGSLDLAEEFFTTVTGESDTRISNMKWSWS